MADDMWLFTLVTSVKVAPPFDMFASDSALETDWIFAVGGSVVATTQDQAIELLKKAILSELSGGYCLTPSQEVEFDALKETYNILDSFTPRSGFNHNQPIKLQSTWLPGAQQVPYTVQVYATRVYC